MAPNVSPSNVGPAQTSEPPATTRAEQDPLDGPAGCVAAPGSGVNTEKTDVIDVIGAQRADPPFWRFVFFLFMGRAGQWWCAVLAAVLLVLLLLLAVTGLVLIARLMPSGGWISGGIGVGSLTSGALLWRRLHR